MLNQSFGCKITYFFTDIGKKKKKKSTMIFSLFPKPMVLASKTYGFRLQNLWF